MVLQRLQYRQNVFAVFAVSARTFLDVRYFCSGCKNNKTPLPLLQAL
jgi:hypothetical protein